MGFVVSKVFSFWTPAGYDVPDPGTGITPRQKEIVQRTWKVVRADTRKNGILLFLKVFELHPEYQPLFSGFGSVPRDQLADNKQMLGHSTAVMYALSAVVDNLDDQECLVEVLKKTGRSHRTKNVSAEHFKNLINIVMVFLKEALGSNVFDKSVEDAWRKSLEVACKIIVGALEGKDYS